MQDGLHPQTQQAMDVLRVVGNNAVHPGEIGPDDDPELVPGLFMLVNPVVEQMISRCGRATDWTHPYLSSHAGHLPHLGVLR
ncbi:hypothetical protein Pta02_73140 [Planobispora takensis]|uniref:DUF4145 domain-containing protein n=1 Tax=Planobispora takensis TaxID=1367882 RepID=A0A8J3WWX9_9ACTN|nr:hypothetical protein Pta02_73140 [Planobispora takensis]